MQQTVGAQQRADVARNRVHTGDAALDDLGAGTDPDFVHTLEHFEGMTHEAMYEAVHGAGGMDAAGLRTLQKVWFESYSDLVNLSTFNQVGLNRIFGNGLWQGASGDAAQAASTHFARAANQVGRVFDSVASRLDALAWSAEAVRAAVQPPPASVTVSPDPDNPVESILPGLVNPEFDDQARAAREQARQAVIRALNSVYTPAFPPAGAGVPAYTNAPQIMGTDGSPGVATSQSSGPGTAGSPLDSNVGAPQNPTGSPATEPASSGAPTLPSGLGLPEGLVPDPGTAPSSATTPAGLTGTPSSSIHQGSSPGGHGLGGPGGPNSVGTGGPGSSVPGAPLSGQPTASAGVGRPSGVGTGAGSRVGPMSPAAGARKKDDDEEATHQSPDYLRRVQSDWTDGIESPAGVIGADQFAGFDYEDYSARGEHSQGSTERYPAPPVTPVEAVTSHHDYRPSPRVEPVAAPQESLPPARFELDRTRAFAPGPADAAAVTHNVDAVSEAAGTGVAESSSSAAVTVSGAGPLDVASTAVGDTPDEQQTVTISGSGPMMDDEGPSSEPRVFTISGTGPLMDDDAAGTHR
ncbi:hypothetical protein [Nocardia barduliensis]|uniref:hypothetical protein n=1 Tax=Nocardia barduliensis TaxID=2736643 RepID=UPI001C2CEFC6|nr:hypothetical protein [Nocardia barduliensis]